MSRPRTATTVRTARGRTLGDAPVSGKAPYLLDEPTGEDAWLASTEAWYTALQLSTAARAFKAEDLNLVYALARYIDKRDRLLVSARSRQDFLALKTLQSMVDSVSDRLCLNPRGRMNVAKPASKLTPAQQFQKDRPS